MALIRVLCSGALTISGSGRTAAARAAVGAVTGGSSSSSGSAAAAVKAAAALLSLVFDASDPSVQQQQKQHAATAATAAGGSSGSAAAAAAKGLGTAAAGGGGSPTKPQAAGRPGSGAAAAPLRDSSLPPSMPGIGSGPLSAPAAAGGAAAAAVDGTTTPPSALLPAVVTDHTSGLAVLRTWSRECLFCLLRTALFCSFPGEGRAFVSYHAGKFSVCGLLIRGEAAGRVALTVAVFVALTVAIPRAHSCLCLLACLTTTRDPTSPAPLHFTTPPHPCLSHTQCLRTSLASGSSWWAEQHPRSRAFGQQCLQGPGRRSGSRSAGCCCCWRARRKQTER